MKGRYPIQNHRFSKRLSFAIAPLADYVVSPKSAGGYWVDYNGTSVSVTLKHDDERVTLQAFFGGTLDWQEVVSDPEAAAKFLVKRLGKPKRKRKKRRVL